VNVFFFWFIAALAGALTPVQSGANGTLGKIFGNPYTPVLISLSVSVIFAIAVALALRGLGVLESARAAEAPWWAWIGGFCGAILVFSQPTAAPALGAAVYIGITVTAAAISSILIDNFGLLGFSLHPASLGRLLGAALMVAGVYLIAIF
jgi:bacterial/archaeal transporter family-2 protein